MAANSHRLLLLLCALLLGVYSYYHISRERRSSSARGRQQQSRRWRGSAVNFSATNLVLTEDTSQLEGPPYRLLRTPLPALPFKAGAKGDFTAEKGSVSQEQLNKMTDAAENAHEKLVKTRKQELNRTDIVSALEPILPQEFGKGKCNEGICRAGWKDVEQRQASVVYLSSVVDLSNYKRKVYIDGGANSYDSSIGGWFLKTYPQASTDFDIYAFEVDARRFKKSYADTGVEFLPFAVWTHNTTIRTAGRMNSIAKASIPGDTKGRVRHMPAIDFVQWLVRSADPEDFVVLKLDIEGAEFEVVEEMVRTRAIHLVDEVFVECHYNQWSRMRPDKTRQDCVDFIMSLRSQGVVAHDWF